MIQTEVGKQQIFFYSLQRKNFSKTVVISKQIELVTPETAQMTDFFKGFCNVMDFDRFSLDLNFFMIDKRKNFFITQIQKNEGSFSPLIISMFKQKKVNKISDHLKDLQKIFHSGPIPASQLYSFGNGISLKIYGYILVMRHFKLDNQYSPVFSLLCLNELS